MIMPMIFGLEQGAANFIYLKKIISSRGKVSPTLFLFKHKNTRDFHFVLSAFYGSL
jgi:hypothetical protein